VAPKSATGPPGPPNLEEVSPGLYSYVQPDGSWCLNNTGLLVGGGRAVVVDSCATEARSRAFLDRLRRVTELPVTTVVNTHHHGDHTFGNFVFEGATVIGHHRCRAEAIEAGLLMKRVFPEVDFGDVRVEPPFVTFEDRLSLWVGDLEVELRHLGPAHTDNDVVAWVPERRVLFAGDIVFNGGTPFLLMGSLAGSLAALDALESLGPAVVVPGHGPVCGPEVFEPLRRYLRLVGELAEQAEAAGYGPLEAARQADLGEFAGWSDPERLVANLHRARSELRGEEPARPLDQAAIWAEMVELNGGQPLRCWA
jgi:cyclase